MSIAKTYLARKPKKAPAYDVNNPSGLPKGKGPNTSAATNATGLPWTAAKAPTPPKTTQAPAAAPSSTSPPWAGATPPTPTDPGPKAGVAPATPGPPPESAAGAVGRTAAREQYGINMADINNRILRAAMDYGGVKSVRQAGYDPSGNDTFSDLDVVDNPNSKLAQVARTLTDQTRATSEDLNNRGSYFSGAHLEQQTRLDDAASRDRLSAQQAFDAAIGDLMVELQKAQAARRLAFSQADLADIAAASDTTPQAEAGGGDSGPPAGAGANPATGQPFGARLQMTGTAGTTPLPAVLTRPAPTAAPASKPPSPNAPAKYSMDSDKTKKAKKKS